MGKPKDNPRIQRLVDSNQLPTKVTDLLDLGINATDAEGKTVLQHLLDRMETSWAQPLWQWTKALLEAGATLEKPYKERLLLEAASYGDLAMIETLLAEGLDVNTASSSGVTMLMRAASGCNPTLVSSLVKKSGINVNAVSTAGKTALMCSLDATFSSQGAWFIALKALLEAGANATINAVDDEGKTALSYAVERHDQLHPDTIISLLEAGATVSSEEEYNFISREAVRKNRHHELDALLASNKAAEDARRAAASATETEVESAAMFRPGR